MKANNDFKKRNSVNLLSLRMNKRPSIMKQRKSVLINKFQPSNKNSNTLSNADLRVKNILSDLLLSIDPDDKKNLEVEKKLKLIEQAKGSQNFDNESDNSNEENNYWTRKISSFKDSSNNSRFLSVSFSPINPIESTFFSIKYSMLFKIAGFISLMTEKAYIGSCLGFTKTTGIS